MWDLPESVDDLNLIYAVNAGTETAVDAKYLVVNDTRQRKVVEHVCEIVPNCCIAVFATALGVEAV